MIKNSSPFFHGVLPRVFLIVFVFCYAAPGEAQCLKFATWNIQDLGRTKDAEEIRLIAQTLRDFDFVAIQEIVAIDPAGAQKVAAIVDELDRMGADWDYKLSDPTTDPVPQNRERYAYLWKTHKLDVLSAKLDVDNEAMIVREPYLAKLRLKKTGKLIWVANFHSLPHGKNPETEISLLASYYPAAETIPLLLMGDWNLDEHHSVWKKFLSFGIKPVVYDSPTTLKRECRDGVYLNHAIDNIYYPFKQMKLVGSGVVDFVGRCEKLAVARGISDHLLVWGEGCF